MIPGKKLRLSGKGQPSPSGGVPGDLFIKTVLLSDPAFKTDEYDLLITRDIKLTEALLGTQITIPTLLGKELNMKIPPGTKHNTKMRIPGEGLPHMKGEGKGDLFIIIRVKMPKHLTDPQMKLVKKLAETGL
jgi:curved DNA-binding protein